MKKKAVITILGLIGGKDNHTKANYYFENNKEKKEEYFNTLPLLIEKYKSTHTIVPIFTKEAKEENQKVLEKSNIAFSNFDDKYFIEDDKNFTKVLNIINSAINEFDELIVDVSHGFRHLPILMIVDLIIQNFQDTSKITKILFAKEIKQFQEYEIIDLKEYLELANISFVLTTFEKNYTVANHIKSEKYKSLLKELNDFSNDLMALNLGNLFKTSQDLINELDKIDNIAIKSQAIKLKKVIENLTDFKNKKRYLVFYELSINLFEKNYILLSLALLFESIRMYIKSYIKKEHKNLVENIENQFNNDIYKIGDFFKNLSWRSYKQFIHQNKSKKRLNISEEDYNILKNSYPKYLEVLYKEIDKKRNNLAHANSGISFLDIKQEVSKLIFQYENLAIKKSI